MSLKRALSEIAPKLAQSRLAYERAAPPPTPLNLTYSITNKCNSRCQSCDIWKIYPAEKERLADELSLEEIERVLRSIGKRVYFFNISGGEPFLRRDIKDIIRIACEILDPAIVHVPTNALMPERVARMTDEILTGMRDWAPNTKLTLKPSFDGVGEFHDWVRGVPGNYAKLERTLGLLKELRAKHDHFRVGVGTVISTRNIDRLPEIIEQAERFEVDTYISEVAEEREEMRNLDSGITPSAEAYGAAIGPFRQATLDRLRVASGMELLTQAMRHEYYEITRRWLAERKQVIPCYAGITNAHISPYGEVWACAILGDSKSLGNLRDFDFDFPALWRSEQAMTVRASIKRKECDCPLANQSYANMLLDPGSMARVAATMARAKLTAGDS